MATYKSIRYIVPTEAVEHTDSINALSDVDTDTTAPTDGQILKWNNTNSKWYPGDVEEEESSGATQKAIFGFGTASSGKTNITNLVSSSGVVATDQTGVGTARSDLAGTGYGGDKAIFGFGRLSSSPYRTNVSNLVSNTGVVSTDSTGVGTVKRHLAAACYGEDKGIFAYGSDHNSSSAITAHSNLVSNTGVVASDNSVSGSAKQKLAAASYGEDKAIFGFGDATSSTTNATNLVSNTGVISSDVTNAGQIRSRLAACGYGGDKAIFGGINGDRHKTNLVSNTGVVASDVNGVGEGRTNYAGAVYGGDKGIFGFGTTISAAGYDYEEVVANFVRLISNTGVVASDTTGVGTARDGLAAAAYSTTA